MNTEVTVNQELIPVQSINVPQLFTDRQKVEFLLSEIRNKAMEHEPDLSTPRGRKEIASNSYKVSQSKTWLIGVGKEYSETLKASVAQTLAMAEQSRLNCKLISETLDALRDEVRKPLTDFETAEAARIEAERAEAAYLQDWDNALAEDDLFNRRREIERKEAELAKQEVERKAKEEAERLERERKEREARIAKEAAERATQEAEDAARKEQERIEREKREAEERAAQAEKDRLAAIEKAKQDAELAEQRRIEAEAKAERDRQQAIKDAEDKARREAEQKERERLAKEAEEKAEAERKARNKAHRKSVNNAALVCFENNGIDTETAKAIIRLISDGMIDYISINY
jgi:colicin import membrane protein